MNLRRMFALLLLLALPLLLVAQEEEESGRPAKPIPAEEKARLGKLLPEPRQVNATAEEAQFYASDLYRYIDGGAEAYHMYNLVAMVHRQYKPKDAEVTVDIYDLGSALNAYGIYTAERSPESRFITIGAEGYIDQNILNFLQGNYYVKLSAFSDTQKLEPVMRAFAEDISRRIGSGKRLPALLSLLPAKNLVAHSEKYMTKAPLGHEFLGPALSAAYSFEGKPSTLLISTAAGTGESKQKFESLKNHFIKTGKAAGDPVLPGAYRGSNALEGEAIFFARGNYTVVFVNPPSDAGAFLTELAGRLSKP